VKLEPHRSNPQIQQDSIVFHSHICGKNYKSKKNPLMSENAYSETKK
jgi:hypothetical protein